MTNKKFTSLPTGRLRNLGRLLSIRIGYVMLTIQKPQGLKKDLLLTNVACPSQNGHFHSGTQADMKALSWCYWSPRKGKVNSTGQQNAVPRSDT